MLSPGGGSAPSARTMSPGSSSWFLRVFDRTVGDEVLAGLGRRRSGDRRGLPCSVPLGRGEQQERRAMSRELGVVGAVGDPSRTWEGAIVQILMVGNVVTGGPDRPTLTDFQRVTNAVIHGKWTVTRIAVGQPMREVAGEWARCPSTATRRSSCAPRSSVRPTASSPSSPARTGKVRAVAKGVRRTKRVRRRLEPFSHVDLQLYEGRSLDIVTQAETLDPTASARRRLPALHRGTAMLETADRLTAEERSRAAAVPAARRGAAHARRREHDARPGARRVPAARAGGGRLGAGAGRVRPVRRAGPHRAFSVAAGGAVCPACRAPGPPPRRPRPSC